MNEVVTWSYPEPQTNSVIVVASCRGNDGVRHALEMAITDCDFGPCRSDVLEAAKADARERLNSTGASRRFVVEPGKAPIRYVWGSTRGEAQFPPRDSVPDSVKRVLTEIERFRAEGLAYKPPTSP